MQSQEEFEAELIKLYPYLYKDMNGDPRYTCMAFGIDLPGPGWYILIRLLSEKLEALILELPEDARNECKAAQCKEKFGGLRFYLTVATQEMHDVAHEFERESYRICVQCGEPGHLYKDGWMRVHCTFCEEKHQKLLRLKC